MSIPTLAIVGRPNVGKSSLFNRLAGSRKSIVEATPGVTRDRVSALCDIDEKTFFELVDTGGVGIVDCDDLTEHVERQIQYAIDQAHLILFIVDGRVAVVLGVVESIIADPGSQQEGFEEAHIFVGVGGDAPKIILEVLVGQHCTGEKEAESGGHVLFGLRVEDAILVACTDDESVAGLLPDLLQFDGVDFQFALVIEVGIDGGQRREGSASAGANQDILGGVFGGEGVQAIVSAAAGPLGLVAVGFDDLGGISDAAVWASTGE